MVAPLSTYFSMAETAINAGQASQPFYQRDDGQLATTSAFFGIRFTARKNENQNTVDAFLNAVQTRHSRDLYEAVRSIFSGRAITSSTPLTAKDIQLAKVTMQKVLQSQWLRENMKISKEIASRNPNLFPPGADVAFARFCYKKGVILEFCHTGTDLNRKLIEFFKSEVLPMQLRQMCLERKMEGKDIHKMIQLLQNTVVDWPLGSSISSGILVYERVMQDVKAKVSEVFDALQGGAVLNVKNLLGHQDRVNMLPIVLKLVKEEGISPKILDDVFASLQKENKSLMEGADKSAFIRSFQIRSQSVKLMEGVLTRNGLPANLAPALGNHPGLQANARRLLDEAVPPPSMIPVPQAQRLLSTTVSTFLETIMAGPIRASMDMAQNPPIDLSAFEKTGTESQQELTKKQLNMETLPKYINALINGPKLPEMLLYTDSAKAGDLLREMEHQLRRVTSCAFGAEGKFGVEDIAKVQQNVVKLFLAWWDEKPDQALVEKVLAKLGSLASDMRSAPGLLNDVKGLDFSENTEISNFCLNGHRILEGTMRGLLELLPPDTLQSMGFAGETPKDRVDAFLARHFQTTKAPEEISNDFRDYVRSMGIPVEPMKPEVAERLEQKAKDGILAAEKQARDAQNLVLNGVLDEFFPTGTSNLEKAPASFHAVFEAGDQKLLGLRACGMDPDLVNAGFLGKVAEKACDVWIAEHRGPVPAKALRAVVRESLEKSFGEMVPLLTAVDSWPGTDAPNGFSDAEKIAAKQCIMGSDLRDLDLVREVVLHGRSVAVALARIAEPPIRLESFTKEVPVLLTAATTLDQYIKSRPGLVGGDAQISVVRAGLSLSGIPEENLQALYAAMNGSTPQDFFGSFVYADKKATSAYSNNKSDYDKNKGKGFIDDEKKLAEVEEDALRMSTLKGATLSLLKIFGEMRTRVATSLGVEIEPEAFFYAGVNAKPVETIPLVCMKTINQISHGTMNLELALAQHMPPLDSASWDTVSRIVMRLQRSARPDQAEALISFMLGNARALLAAQGAVKGNRALTPAEIWKAVTQKSAPRDLTHEHLGERLHDFMITTYSRTLQTAYPQMGLEQRQAVALEALGAGVAFPKALELIKPRKALLLADIAQNMSLPPLVPGDGPIERLLSDFPKRGYYSTMTFTPKIGASFVTRPNMDIPGNENTVNHPPYSSMIAMAGSMSQREEQKLRILQCFTQAPLDMPVALGSLFPDRSIWKTGHVAVTATQQADDSVVVELRSTNHEQLLFTQSFVIKPDGSYNCTAFRMERNRG